MNVIGEIGNFIMIYQVPIQLAVVAMLVVGGIVCVGKIISNAVKKRRLLEEINKTVSEINDSLKSKGNQKTEVIYIDGRVTPGDQRPTPFVDENPQDAKAAQTEADGQENDKVPEEVTPVVKYFSRDCAISKDGRKYTIEELDAQIRD